MDIDDRLEHWLTRVAAEITFQITAEAAARWGIKTGRPHGDANLLPSWALQAASETTKQIFQQQGRVNAQRGRGRGGAAAADGQVGGAQPKRRARRQCGRGRGGADAPAAGSWDQLGGRERALPNGPFPCQAASGRGCFKGAVQRPECVQESGVSFQESGVRACVQRVDVASEPLGLRVSLL